MASLLTRWFSRPAEPIRPSKELTLGEVVDRYELVDVVHEDGNSYLVVSDPRMPYKHAEPDRAGQELALREGRNISTGSPSFAEIGTSSPSPFVSFIRQEYNPELMGLEGLKKYDRMRKSDGTVRGTLRAMKTPVLAARWFVEPASNSKKDQDAADFIWKCLTDYMSISWSQVVVEALLMCEFGYYMFEKVWENREVDGKTRTVLKKLAPRHPMDVRSWNYDKHGGPTEVEMEPMEADFDSDPIIIPIEKLCIFSFDREAGNMEGISVLRSAYKHWFYKENLYKIDAIQKERHGIGVPVIKLPPGFDDKDRQRAHELGRNLRTNERAHVVLPPLWELEFAKLEGQPVSCMESIEHHDSQITNQILAAFMGKTAKPDDLEMFLKATRFIADIICDVFNLYVIPQLIDYNFQRGVKTPKLRARRIGEQNDWRTESFAIRNYVGAGVILPDEKLEEYIRMRMDLPPIDEETVRMPVAPQAPKVDPAMPPGKGGPTPPGQPAPPKPAPVGPPRQSPPSAQPPRGNGADKSGGK